MLNELTLDNVQLIFILQSRLNNRIEVNDNREFNILTFGVSDEYRYII